MADLGDDGMEMDEEPKAVKAIEEMGEFNTRQRMMVSSLVEVTHDAGKFDQGVGANGAHYMPAAKNPFASQGIACEYCFFYQPDGQCAIVEGVVEEYGVCKLWIIPEAVITMETMEAEAPAEEMMEEAGEEMDEEMAEDAMASAESVRKALDTSDTMKVEAVKFARRLLGRD
jgi:Pyruvate/2-oxoacid:ferredoxin oxidoreductase delta subunit